MYREHCSRKFSILKIQMCLINFKYSSITDIARKYQNTDSKVPKWIFKRIEVFIKYEYICKTEKLVKINIATLEIGVN